MNVFKALLKREFWEHKGSLLYTPAIIAAVFAAFFIIAGLTGETMQINDQKMSFSQAAPELMAGFAEQSEERQEAAMLIYLNWPVTMIGFVLLVVSLFYALGCLYDERKDRSILFWKSLPISDLTTVASKYVSIVIMAPLFYFAAITLFQIFLMIFATIGAWIGGESAGPFWSSVNLFSVVFNTLFSLILASIWLSPVWAWCMLASSWAKRVAFLWGLLPLLTLFVAEGMIFRSSYVAEAIGEYIGIGFVIQNAYMDDIASGGNAFDEIAFEGIGQAFTSVQFFIGALIAVLFLSAAVYTRRMRDEA